MTDSRPQWKINKSKRDVQYNREHSKKITIQLYEKDYKYITYWKSIPNKAEWFKAQLDEYAKENSLD